MTCRLCGPQRPVGFGALTILILWDPRNGTASDLRVIGGTTEPPLVVFLVTSQPPSVDRQPPSVSAGCPQ